jgi:serine protease Do
MPNPQTTAAQTSLDKPKTRSLPSLAPLVELVMPAIVNISVELKEQAATQSQGDTGGDAGKDSGSPIGPGGTPFDQFLKRFFEKPFQFRNPAEKVMALGSGFIVDPTGYIVPTTTSSPIRTK